MLSRLRIAVPLMLLGCGLIAGGVGCRHQCEQLQRDYRSGLRGIDAASSNEARGSHMGVALQIDPLER